MFKYLRGSSNEGGNEKYFVQGSKNRAILSQVFLKHAWHLKPRNNSSFRKPCLHMWTMGSQGAGELL
jgi:hypothetical protein